LQVHDFNGGIYASGLFWTVEFPDSAVSISDNNRRIQVHARDIEVIDSFQGLGPKAIPASVSFDLDWVATGPTTAVGQGGKVPATDRTAFLGQHRDARSTGTFSGEEWDFQFQSNGRASTDQGYAEIIVERNGVFLS